MGSQRVRHDWATEQQPKTWKDQKKSTVSKLRLLKCLAPYPNTFFLKIKFKTKWICLNKGFFFKQDYLWVAAVDSKTNVDQHFINSLKDEIIIAPIKEKTDKSQTARIDLVLELVP